MRPCGLPFPRRTGRADDMFLVPAPDSPFGGIAGQHGENGPAVAELEGIHAIDDVDALFHRREPASRQGLSRRHSIHSAKGCRIKGGQRTLRKTKAH